MSKDFILKTKTECYTRDDLKRLSDDELLALRDYCNNAIGDISTKRTEYQNHNTEEKNSKSFWDKMNNYKRASIKFANAARVISDILKQRRIDIHKQEQHLFYSFHEVAKNTLPSFMYKRILNKAKEIENGRD